MCSLPRLIVLVNGFNSNAKDGPASLSDIQECILPVSHKANTSSEQLPLDTLTVATGIKPRVSKSDALDAQAELLLLEAAAGAAEDLSGFCEPEESDCFF